MQACPISRDVLSIRRMTAPVLLLLPPPKETRPRPCSLPAQSIQQEVSSDSSWYFLEGSFHDTPANACSRDAYGFELAPSGRLSVGGVKDHARSLPQPTRPCRYNSTRGKDIISSPQDLRPGQGLAAPEGPR